MRIVGGLGRGFQPLVTFLTPQLSFLFAPWALAITILTGGNTLPKPHPLYASGVSLLDPQLIFHNSHTEDS